MVLHSFTHDLALSILGKYLMYGKRDHKYRDGYQHRSNLEHRISQVLALGFHVRAQACDSHLFLQAASFVFFLQNKAGAAKWPIDMSLVEELSHRFGAKRAIAGQ